jgi:3-hydroxyacyl-[acyl-carrier-protein] dehydratase
MSIELAKFRRPVVPGEQLQLRIALLRNRGKVWKFRGEAHVGDALAAEAEFTAMIVPPDDPRARG